jgi:hypothetical protein
MGVPTPPPPRPRTLADIPREQLAKALGPSLKSRHAYGTTPDPEPAIEAPAEIGECVYCGSRRSMAPGKCPYCAGDGVRPPKFDLKASLKHRQDYMNVHRELFPAPPPPPPPRLVR